MADNVVVEKNGDPNKALSIVCPRCNAPKNHLCDTEKHMICAERVVALFAKEAAPIAGPFDTV